METTYLTQKEFDTLLEYSTSIPTGTTIGKRWKRHRYYFKNTKGAKFNAGYLPGDVVLISDEWSMGEYITHDDPKLVGIKWTNIIVAGEYECDKLIAAFKDRKKGKR
jgi:hypothetical protein